MENEEDGIKWILESTDVALSSGDNGQLNLTAQRLAEVSGNVFWDLNDNGVYNIGEGINNATLTVLPGTCDENSSSDSTVVQNTDSSGEWSSFEAVGGDYCLEISAEGFSDTSQDLDLGDTSLEIDSMMMACLLYTSPSPRD